MRGLAGQLLLPHYRHSALQLDNFVLEHSVLDLEVLQRFLEELACLLVLAFPFVNYLLLLDHDLVSAFLGMPVLFFLLQELVLELGNLDVALVIELVDSVMVDDLEPVQLIWPCPSRRGWC